MEMHHLTAIITQLYQFESDDTYSKFQSLKLIQSLTMIEIEPIYKDRINFLKNTQFSTQDLIKNQKKKKRENNEENGTSVYCDPFNCLNGNMHG